jgi:hypothetical protein
MKEPVDIRPEDLEIVRQILFRYLPPMLSGFLVPVQLGL